MTREQLLYLVLGEECTEVAQLTSKIIRFGAQEIFPDQQKTNAGALHLELDDLMAQIEMLNDECGLQYYPNRDRIEAKKLKFNKFANYSIEIGTVRC